MINYKEYKTAIFDCDGVILDSNQIKTKAFAKALSDEPLELVDEFIQYHQLNGGVSRYAKFQYYFEKLKKSYNYQEESQLALLRYAAIVEKALISSNLVPGVEKFLEELYQAQIPCFVSSGSDQTELRQVFQKKDIAKYFKRILGSPSKKHEHLAGLVTENRLAYLAVFFGDAMLDYQVASSHQLDFVFISSCSEWQQGIRFCKENNVSHFENFNELIKQSG